MRAFILMMAAVSLAVTTGCEMQNQNNNRDLPVAVAGTPTAATAPRVNLYPLTSPPPGTVQPLVGYAPTRIAATQYGPEIYRDETGNVELAARNPATFEDTFGLTRTTAAAATGTEFAPAADAAQFAPFDPFTQPAPAAFDPNATVAAVTYPATYNPNDPNDPYYCPPGSEFCPVPGSPVGAPTVATPAASFGVMDAQSVQPTNMYASATVPVTPVYQTATYTTTTASYTAPVSAPITGLTPAPIATVVTAPAVYATAPAVYTPAPVPAPYVQQPMPVVQSYVPPPAPAPAAPVYTPPLRLSATAYTPPPARTPASPAPFTPYPRDPYSRETQSVSSFGANEGTADIVGPVPSLDPIVRGGYSPSAPIPAPYAQQPYAQPYSQPYGQPQPLSTTAPIIPAAAPLTPATPESATAVRRPLLLSAAVQAQQTPQMQPVSSVAGVSVSTQVGAANASASGYQLIPALDVPPGNHPNDFGPSQWFEVVRPGNGAVRIGRISATCACVGARIPKRSYGAGERILVEARMLSKPAANNLTYGLYVNIVEPVEAIVDADVTLRY